MGVEFNLHMKKNMEKWQETERLGLFYIPSDVCGFRQVENLNGLIYKCM